MTTKGDSKLRKVALNYEGHLPCENIVKVFPGKKARIRFERRVEMGDVTLRDAN